LDVPIEVREDWDRLTNAFVRTFREAGGEARALGRLSTMTMKRTESVRKYGERVKGLIQKLTTEIAPNVQMEWYVAGFPKEMGFHIRQSRPASLREAMEAAKNYKNSAQSLRKSLKRSDQKEGKNKKHRHRDRKKKKKYSESESSNSSSSADSNTEESGSSESEPESKYGKTTSSKVVKSGRDKGTVRVKVEQDDVMKSIKESLDAIRVNLAENRMPRKIVPTSRSNVWCPRCKEHGHFASECTQPVFRRSVQFVDPETGVYYTIPEEEDDEEMQPVYQIQPGYGRGRGQAPRPQVATPRSFPRVGSSANPGNQLTGYAERVIYCYKCGGPGHYANSCLLPSSQQGGMLQLPCQNCGKYGHTATQCPEPPQPRVLFKTVEVPPREQTGLNYGHTSGVENLEK
jgi:hypothetical protein